MGAAGRSAYHQRHGPHARRRRLTQATGGDFRADRPGADGTLWSARQRVAGAAPLRAMHEIPLRLRETAGLPAWRRCATRCGRRNEAAYGRLIAVLSLATRRGEFRVTS